TLSVLLSTSAADLSAALASLFTPLAAVSFLLFTLLYTPCAAAVATINKELKSRLATLGVVVMQCAVAWIVAVAVFQIGRLFI
ncbi:MAG: ferrous iron transport protein B, partial [Papillibacter sp.]|nr:ferrous iron transport protein B [Papillibacter sp.]